MSDHDPFIDPDLQWDPVSLRAELAETQRRLEQADHNCEQAREDLEAYRERVAWHEATLRDTRGQLTELRKAAAALLAETDGEGSSHASRKAARDWVAGLLREGGKVGP
jgi:chromosome segregation ATPase